MSLGILLCVGLTDVVSVELYVAVFVTFCVPGKSC